MYLPQDHAPQSREKAERKSITDRAAGLVDGAGSYVKSHVKSIRRAFNSTKDTTAASSSSSSAAAAAHTRRSSVEHDQGTEISTSPPSDAPLP